MNRKLVGLCVAGLVVIAASGCSDSGSIEHASPSETMAEEYEIAVEDASTKSDDAIAIEGSVLLIEDFDLEDGREPLSGVTAVPNDAALEQLQALMHDRQGLSRWTTIALMRSWGLSDGEIRYVLNNLTLDDLEQARLAVNRLLSTTTDQLSMLDLLEREHFPTTVAKQAIDSIMGHVNYDYFRVPDATVEPIRNDQELESWQKQIDSLATNKNIWSPRAIANVMRLSCTEGEIKYVLDNLNVDWLEQAIELTEHFKNSRTSSMDRDQASYYVG